MMSLLLVSTLYAKDPFVFVAPERTTLKTQDVGSKLADVLKRQLESDGIIYMESDATILGVNDQDNGQDYLATCMVKDSVAYRTCVYQISKANAWEYSINFEVMELASGYRVTTWIQDIDSDDEVATPPLDIQEDSFQQWAQIISVSYQNVQQNGVQHVDLRQADLSKEELLRLMKEQLADQTIDPETRVDLVFSEREDITMADIERIQKEEGITPWEELDLKPKEYMQYYNLRNRDPSFTIQRWRDLMSGRKGGIYMDLAAGGSSLPIGGLYYGYKLRSNFDFSIIETAAWQTVETQLSGQIEASIGYGVTPELLFSVFVGQASSDYELSLWWITIDNNQPSSRDLKSEQGITYFGSRIMYGMPTINAIQPAIAVSGGVWGLDSAVSYIEPNLQAEFPELESPQFFMLNVEPTVNVRLADKFELWVRVPVTYAVPISGDKSAFQSVEELQYTENEEMPSYSPLGYGAHVGVRLKLAKP